MHSTCMSEYMFVYVWMSMCVWKKMESWHNPIHLNIVEHVNVGAKNFKL